MAYNILIVDDSKVVRTVVARTLQMSGLDVGSTYEAANGQEALDLLDKMWVDIVFADINMPVMSGLEMVDRMVDRNLLGTIPVVIISTERSITRIEELKSKGISAYLRKPFTPENIKHVVDRILGAAQEAGCEAAPAGA